MLPEIRCEECGQRYPEDGMPYVCTACGGLYDIKEPIPLVLEKVERDQPGIWRYRQTFGSFGAIQPVSLGEGNTPIVWADVFGRRIAFKCEYLNPTGSFKDRGSSLIATWLKSRGVTGALEDSSGNAGASLAAYAARENIKLRVYAPSSASGPKRRQIEVYGAELVAVTGSRNDTAEAVKQAAKAGDVYASHAYLPFNIPGYATAAYEIFEQLGNTMPGAVVVPAGQGGLLLGLDYGFATLRIANYKLEKPKLIGGQALECAPLWKAFSGDQGTTATLPENQTMAEGICVRHPVRLEKVVKAVIACGGGICAVTENEILLGWKELARLGFYVEPTSAVIWSALKQTIMDLPDPVVVILTGSGLKQG